MVFVEDFGVPAPGETILIAGGIYAGAGRLNIVTVAVIAFAAAVAGDNVGYLIGRCGGRAVVHRWGRYVLLSPERFHKAEEFFTRHGGQIVTVARFIEGLRQANGIIAGTSGMPLAPLPRLQRARCRTLGRPVGDAGLRGRHPHHRSLRRDHPLPALRTDRSRGCGRRAYRLACAAAQTPELR
ncbi:DedA family protein [Streptomyces sp. NPDC014864]|uniref:DedA family protein n=1 Tax=Streptomyces sp. NPDC014864 TaxID=3364924 RepID=UPI0036FD2140